MVKLENITVKQNVIGEYIKKITINGQVGKITNLTLC